MIITTLSFSYYPLDDFWTNVSVDFANYIMAGLFVAILIQGILSIAFINTKAAEDAKKTIVNLFNKIPDAVLVLEKNKTDKNEEVKFSEDLGVSTYKLVYCN